ncbi:MAG TPA: ParB N-terminal domain-containing protein, partial [bacterium]
MKSKTVLLVQKEEIRPDFFFCFASPSDLAPLTASIKVSGIQTPLCVRRSHDGYDLCAGFRRFRAASDLGLAEVPVRLLPAEMPVGEWLLEVLLEHLSMRSLNLVEKARVMRIAQSAEGESENRMKTFSALLGLPPHPDAFREIKNILELHPGIQAIIERFLMPFKTARRLFLFSVEEQGWLAHLASELSLRPVELFEIGTALRDSCMRENRSFTEQVGLLGVKDLLARPDWNRNQKIERLKQKLQVLGHPSLLEWNKRLEPLRREASLPEGVGLS